MVDRLEASEVQFDTPLRARLIRVGAGLLMLTASAFIAFGPRGVGNRAFGYFGLVLFAYPTVNAIYRAIRPKPPLILVADGFIDNTTFAPVGFVAWNEVATIRAVGEGNRASVRIYLTDPVGFLYRLPDWKRALRKSRVTRAGLGIGAILLPLPVTDVVADMKGRWRKVTNPSGSFELPHSTMEVAEPVHRPFETVPGDLFPAPSESEFLRYVAWRWVTNSLAAVTGVTAFLWVTDRPTLQSSVAWWLVIGGLVATCCGLAAYTYGFLYQSLRGKPVPDRLARVLRLSRKDYFAQLCLVIVMAACIIAPLKSALAALRITQPVWTVAQAAQEIPCQNCNPKIPATFLAGNTEIQTFLIGRGQNSAYYHAGIPIVYDRTNPQLAMSGADWRSSGFTRAVIVASVGTAVYAIGNYGLFVLVRRRRLKT